ncbi:MAG: hypothetical protein ABEH43_02555, partial [Flavobacteriales bacterium]
VLEPAEVELPEYIKTIGIFHRKQGTYSHTNEVKEKLQYSIMAASRSTEGFSSIIQESPKFKIKELYTEKPLYNGVKLFPRKVGWKLINQLCNDNEVDAIVILENINIL